MMFYNIAVILLSISGLFIGGVPLSHGAKILGVFTFHSNSHSIMYNEIVRELVKRGHELTVITNTPLTNMPKNYNEILIDPPYDHWQQAVATGNLFELNTMTLHGILHLIFDIGIRSTAHVLAQSAVQDFIHNNTDPFDLLLVEQFCQEATLLFAHKYNIPIVTISTFSSTQYLYPMMGIISPWAHVPHEFLNYNDRMTFLQRVHNVWAGVYDYMWRNFYYLPLKNEIAVKFFSHLKHPLPTIQELEKRVALVLLNSYIPIITPRPSLSNMINVGGLHIKEPKSLPPDMQSFLDEAKDGVIYFSLGTNLRSVDIHPDKLRSLLSVFSQLKQHVLWKFENEEIENLPKNIMVKKWMPQNDILAHPNIKIFITHGGLFSTQEGIYYGVPMLGIPVFADQFLNINKARLAGYAVQLLYQNITETSLSWAINELLCNLRYKHNIRQASKQFRDRPLNPRNESMYWIEYIVEHKGAAHLQSSARDLNWLSLMLIDVILFYAIVVLIFAYICVIFIKKLLKLFINSPSKHGKIE